MRPSVVINYTSPYLRMRRGWGLLVRLGISLTQMTVTFTSGYPGQHLASDKQCLLFISVMICNF